MSFEDALGMPVKAFWMMTNMIYRVAADEDTRQLTLQVNSQSGEGAQEYRKELDKQVGKIVREEQTLDMDGWAALKSMAGWGNRCL